jgi:hypothetical protein
LSSAAALLARLLYMHEAFEQSEHYCRVSEDAASEDDVFSQVLWRGTRARLLARTGDRVVAEELVNSSVAQAQQTDFLMLHADALADRAAVLTGMGRTADAARDLEQAIGLYERKQIHPSEEVARRRYRSLVSGAGASVSA